MSYSKRYLILNGKNEPQKPVDHPAFLALNAINVQSDLKTRKSASFTNEGAAKVFAEYLAKANAVTTAAAGESPDSFYIVEVMEGVKAAGLTWADADEDIS